MGANLEITEKLKSYINDFELLQENPNNQTSVKITSPNAIIDPRMGPKQGVQPKPKAAPTSNGKAKLLLYWLVKILVSLFIKSKFIIPISWREKNIITIPATILKIFELNKKNFPISEAVEPNVIKTKEKPSVKKIVLKIIKFLFLSFILSNDVPEIYEIYPGINGKTQGDKKLTSPAKKAIDSVVVISTSLVYSFFVISIGLFFFLKKKRLHQQLKLWRLMKYHK